MPGTEEKMWRWVGRLRAGGHTLGCYVGGAGPHGPPGKERRLCTPESVKGESRLPCLNSNLHALHRNLREQRRERERKKKRIQGQLIGRSVDGG